MAVHPQHCIRNPYPPLGARLWVGPGWVRLGRAGWAELSLAGLGGLAGLAFLAEIPGCWAGFWLAALLGLVGWLVDWAG